MSRRSKRRVQVSDDEEVAQQSPAKRGRVAFPDESDEEANGTFKRRILNKGKGRAVDVEQESEQEADEEEVAQRGEDDAERFRPELQRGDDDYVVGSVTRIKLTNFMTYDFVQFRPGPRLNMILGPNGTGKSSIAAAIAIGLGFSPLVMGRAPNLQAYVKQGTTNTETELELKAPRGKVNYIVTRRFQTGNEKSTWLLNGKSSSKRDVDILVANLGVQANNLCSFLPQDKVAEFAKMDPIAVLRETMRAAGDSRLSKWHGELSQYGKEVKTIDETLSAAIHQRDNLQLQVDELEPDVRNFTRRRDLEQQLTIWRLLSLAAEGDQAHDQARQYQAHWGTREGELRNNQNQLNKLQELRQVQDDRIRKEDDKLQKISQTMQKHDRAVIKADGDAAAAHDDGRDLQTKLDQINDQKKRRAARLRQQEDKIRELEEQAAEPEVDVAEQLKNLKTEATQKTAQMRQLQNERDKLEDQVREHGDCAARLHKQIEDNNARKEQLNNVDAQRRTKAFQFDPSIKYAVEWIEANEMKFESKIHFPPMISVNVPNTSYAWQVEACTSVAQRKTFICQSQADYRTLMSLNNRQVIVDGRQIKVALHIARIEVTEESVNPRRPCTPEQVAELGFDGFAIDFVEAEAPVVAYLCEVLNMHKAAITLKDSSRVNAEAMVAAGVTQWVTRTDANRAIQSRYGKRESTITVSAAVPPRVFNISVETDKIKEIEENVANFKRELKHLEQPLGKLKAELENVRRSFADAERNCRAAQSAFKKLQEKAQQHQRAHLALEHAREQLQRLRNQPDPENAREELKDNLRNLIKQRYEHLKRGTDAKEAYGDASVSFTHVSMKKAQYTANVAEIKSAISVATEKMETLQNEKGTLKEHQKKWLRRSRVIADRLTELLGGQRPEIQTQFGEKRKEDIPTENIQNEMAVVQAQLEASVGVSAETVQRHKRLTEQLNEKKTIVAQLQKDHLQIKTKVNKILHAFNPALDALVEEASVKFSEAFARVKCNGQLEVDREGDYASWGIKILVAFRDGEALETLKMHRHSGGERSLATVTYLMSLSNMSRTPFSLVDEINQGMDARAERNVHHSMINVTCEGNVGQYFLITPKLLTGLDYHQNMKVLIINNGPWIPEGDTKTLSYGSFGQCLAKYRAAHGITA